MPRFEQLLRGVATLAGKMTPAFEVGTAWKCWVVATVNTVDTYLLLSGGEGGCRGVRETRAEVSWWEQGILALVHIRTGAR